MNKINFIKGFIRNLSNPKISLFSFVASNTQMDKTVVVYRGAKIKDSTIGAHTYISHHTDIENASIGKYCSIADYCRIGMASHSSEFLSTSPIFTLSQNALHAQWIEQDVSDTTHSQQHVTIGNDVWIGSHVLIKGGITIGDGAIIGAGAVVVKDIPPYAVVGGVPAKLIRYRFGQEIINELLQVKWWDMPEHILKKHIHLFQAKDINMKALKELQKG